eukprot:TRINITY_DN63383_c0_g1_i1.p1 TRINITY_DN63383_c0_g1~~TRINITY_DN63383_c0_g1_i1.p1  ORF type:complete len:582 (+),score=102.90 TRINITY_DN63383_c0_g1_i1:97-1746(+)
MTSAIRIPRRGSGKTLRQIKSRAGQREGIIALCDPTQDEILKAVTSLCEDELRPYGRILRKRLGEFAEEEGKKASNICEVGRLRTLCEENSKLRVEPAGEADWSVVIKGSCTSFVDIYAEEDVYPEELWEAASTHFSALGEDEMNLPGGRYVSAQGLMALKLPFLEGYSLGQVCHFVQIAMTQRKLLGYLNGAIVPYGRSQTAVRERCAEQLSLCRKSKYSIATWDKLHACIAELLKEDPKGGLPLSNVKRVLRNRFQCDLSETALGHASVSELFKDVRLHDVCCVMLLDNGYYVFPASHSKTASASTAATSSEAASNPETPPSTPGKVKAMPRPMLSFLATTSPTTPSQRGMLLATSPPPASAQKLEDATTRPTSAGGMASPVFSDTSSLLATTPHKASLNTPWDLTCSALGMGTLYDPWTSPDPLPTGFWLTSVPSYSANSMLLPPSVFEAEPEALEDSKPRPVDTDGVSTPAQVHDHGYGSSTTDMGTPTSSIPMTPRQAQDSSFDTDEDDCVLMVRNTFLDFTASPTRRARRAVSESAPRARFAE